MQAVTFEGPEKATVKDVDEPRIEAPSDAIVRVTTAAICGSDLHMYRGRTSAKKGLVFGHEILGVIEETGPGVEYLREGDRVVLPFNIACGACANCQRGLTSACTVMNPDPEVAGAAFGYADMGPYPGGQAPLVRLPRADVNALRVPGQPHDQWEDDFVLLADVFPTGYHGAMLAHVLPGRTVAVFGAGPVGLLAAYSSLLRGACEVYVVDHVDERLAKAKAMGAIPIDFRDGDPVEQIKAKRKDSPATQTLMRPGEQDKMQGVLCGIDAVGYEAEDWAQAGRERPTRVLEDLARVVDPTGHVGVIGVYLESGPRGPGTKDEKEGWLQLPFAELWSRGLSVAGSQTPVRQYDLWLRDLICAGRAKPSQIVTHRIHIDEAPDFYAKFDEAKDGVIKVLIKFDGA